MNQEMLFTTPKPTKELFFYKNSQLGKRCFILGNGPSLSIADIELLRWEFTFVSNKFYYCFKDISFKPTFYSVEDSLVIRQHYKEIDNITDIPCFIPLKFKKYFSARSNQFFFNVNNVDKSDLINNKLFPQFSLDCLSHICWGSSIIYTQLQLAVYMGFKDIYLLGMDHNYTVQDISNNNVLTYKNESNHFIKNYLQKDEKWNKPQLEVLSKSFYYANTFCTKIGVNIVNLSRKTKLEAFTRSNLDEVLKKDVFA